MSEKLYDVFISYSTIDSERAFQLLEVLEQNGLNCWIAPRNIPDGTDWAAEIDRAIEHSRVFVVIVSANSQGSKQVPKEIGLAIPACEAIFPFRIDNVELKGGFRYYLSGYQFINAVDQTQVKMQELADAICAALKREKDLPGHRKPAAPQETKTAPAPGPGGKKKRLIPILLVLLVLAAALILILTLGKGETDGDETTQPEAVTTTAPETTTSKPDAPDTDAPETAAPDTIPPTTAAPSTQAPTEAPTEALTMPEPDPERAVEVDPLFGSWTLVTSEHRGQAKAYFTTDGHDSLQTFLVFADRTVEGYYKDVYFPTLVTSSADGRTKLVSKESSLNFTDVFKPSWTKPEGVGGYLPIGSEDTIPDDAPCQLTTTGFFLDSYYNTVPYEEGPLADLSKTLADPEGLLEHPLYRFIYPDRYLVLHISGTCQTSPVEQAQVNSWYVFQRDYPYCASARQATLAGTWRDSQGNTWKFAKLKDESELQFSLTAADGTSYTGTDIISYKAEQEKGDFFERITFKFDGFSMKKYAVVYYGSSLLYLLDGNGNPLVLTRVK